MSYIRIPTKSEGQLPEIPSDEEVENHAPIEVTPWKCRRQIFATLVVCIGVFNVGNMFGWAAVAIPLLKRDKKIYDTEASEALVASLFIIGAMFAGPASGYLMYRLGRRMTTFGFALIASFGWALIPSPHFIQGNIPACETLLCVGRFITGFAGAGCLVAAPVYIREMCDEAVRTAMGSLVPLVMVSGNTFCFAFGVIMPWWVLSLICMAFAILLSCLIFCVPDSPRQVQFAQSRHLLTMGKDEEAKKALSWLNHGYTLEEQERMFKRVKRGVQFLSKNANRAMKQSERKQQEKRLKLKLNSREVLHPLLLSIILIFLQQGTGTNVIATYTQDVLQLGEAFISTETGTVIIGITFVFAVLTATLVVERLGRKPLILVGTMMTFLAQAILGCYFYYHHLAVEKFAKGHKKDLKFIITNFSWIPIFCTNLFVIFYALGLGSVIWIMAVEINHPDFQEIAGTLDSMTYWLTAFTSTATLPSLREAINYHWCFWIYAGNCFIAFWFCLFFVYETKGKTQEDIMAHFRGYLQNPEDDDEDDESKSIGSIINVKKRHGHGDSQISGTHNRNRMSGDSTASTDSEVDLETLFELEIDDVMK